MTVDGSNSAEARCVCYSVGGFNSAAWLDGKPHTGCYATEISRTLDSNNCCYPGCNQGGVCVVEIYSTGKPPGRLKGEDFR